AVELYRGDLLATVSEDFLRGERERLRNVQIANLIYLISAERTTRNYRGAFEQSARLQALDPWREDVVRQIMVLRFEAGDRAGALAAYDQFAERISEELGAEPMSETQAAYASVLEGRLPALDDFVSLSLQPQVAEPARHLPFVGRGPEIGTMRAAWSRAARGHGTVVMISGAAGIGKSRLVGRLWEDIVDQGGYIAYGRASDAGNLAYEPFVQALSPFIPSLGRSGLDNAVLAALASLLPELTATRDSLGSPVKLAADDERRRLFEAVAAAFTVLAETRPLAVVVEDVHWATDITLDLLEFLSHRLAELPILIVATYREEEIARTHRLRELRRSLGRQQRLTAIALAPLERRDLDDLVSALAEARYGGKDLAALLYERSEGNPFFAGEILRDALESGVVRLESGTWRVVEAPPTVPPTLLSTIERRIERLSASTRLVAALCSTVGRNFDVEVVSEAGGWTEAQAVAAIGELVDRKMVVESQERPEDQFAFSHDLMRQTFYEMQPAQERRRRHRRIAEVLESFRGTDARAPSSILALHFDRGGDADRAIPHYLAAARRALALSAPRDSADLCRRGLELAGDSAARLDLLLVRSSALELLADHKTRMQDLLDALEISTKRQDEDLEFDVRCRLIFAHHDLADSKAVEAELTHLERLATRGAMSRRALVHFERGRSLKWASELAGAEVELRSALELLDQTEHAATVFEITWQLGEIARLRGDVATAAHYLELCSDMARVSESPLQIMECLWNRARLECTQDRAQETHRATTELLNLTERCGAVRVAADAHDMMAIACIALGRFDEALEHAGAAAELGDRWEMQVPRSGGRRTKANALRLLGRYREALALYEEALEIARRAGLQVTQAIILGELSHALFLGGRGDSVEATSLEAVAFAERTDSETFLGLAGAIRGLVLIESAREATGLLERGVLAARVVYGQSTSLGAFLGGLALARQATGDHVGAVATAAEASSHLAGKPQDVDAAYGYWAAARVARALGDEPLFRKRAALARDTLRTLATALAPDAKADFLAVPWHAAVLGSEDKVVAGERRSARSRARAGRA
ncbi:MAG TPA: AAA family ATPase, partial [Candidatus Baltobacteraceae bacterium]|nr:AAA family ATPase [Candidatus Baltobacteraceae bacterium]